MPNQNVNKVIYGGRVLIDLTGDTVDPSKLLKDLKLTTRVELKLKVLAHLMLILRMPPLSLLKSCLERLRM